MKIGVVSELTGGSDICERVTDFSSLQALQFLAPGETVLFALSSPKEEYAFTNEALVSVCGDSAMSSKRTVVRYEYIFERVVHVTFETCGVADRDCELKRSVALSRAQAGNGRAWEFARSALDSAVRSTRITQPPETSTSSLASLASGVGIVVDHAASVQTWFLEAFAKSNPRCYRAVIQGELERLE